MNDFNSLRDNFGNGEPANKIKQFVHGTVNVATVRAYNGSAKHRTRIYILFVNLGDGNIEPGTTSLDNFFNNASFAI